MTQITTQTQHQAVDREALLAEAERIGPLLREHAAEGEAQRRPAQAMIEALREAGLFRLLVPQPLGGLEVDPVTCGLVIEAAARFDSAAGWAIMVANSVDWWCSRLPDEGAEEIYTEGPDTILATAFQPPVEATAVDGGFRLSGKRPLASNVHDADWLMLTAQLPGKEETFGAILPVHEAEIVDSWHSLGMRGTDSNDVVVDGAFVPSARTFAMAPEFKPGRHYTGPLYGYPPIGEAAVVVPPTALAVAREAIDELRDLAQGKTPFGSGALLRQRGVAQAKLGRAEAILRSARQLFYTTLEEAWERTVAGTPSTLEQKADLALAGAHAVASAVEAVDLVYSLAGTSAIYARSPLERHFRDVQTIRHHGFCSEGRYETAGQVYLGVEPEFGFVAL
ncbi:MAG: acyl-CoA dehydrogenase family protein [Solirubrobacterales bacterium]